MVLIFLTTMAAYQTSVYTRKQLKAASIRGQMKGWAQGAGATFLMLLLLKVVGWIPALALVAVVGYSGYRILQRSKSSDT